MTIIRGYDELDGGGDTYGLHVPPDARRDHQDAIRNILPEEAVNSGCAEIEDYRELAMILEEGRGILPSGRHRRKGRRLREE
ncbi:MAG: hypothetical protein Q8P57_04005 [Candidatus Pacearchaeota archaeon]|nr:hypothetical protein [Candidatus Pacearchaeota archaeon]